MIAMTATATQETKEHVIKTLGLLEPVIISNIPQRDNIKYYVINTTSKQPEVNFKWFIGDIIENGYKATRVIVFCRKMNDLRDIYNCFNDKFSSCYFNFKTRPYAMYHARTDEKIKDFIISSFDSADGTVRFLVATVAFGMGIDCKGLYNVIHYGPAAELDDYFQEAGRGGRDGSSSHAVLMLYPKCLASKNISSSTKLYCKNNTVCRRKLLMAQYQMFPSLIVPNHDCCDVCERNCSCVDGCKTHVPSFVNASYNIVKSDII